MGATQLFQLAQQLVQIPSLTPLTPDLQPAARQSLDLIQAFAQESGAQCHRLIFEGGHAKWGYPVDNLYVEWPGDGGRHLCFLGHTDVVPPGDASAWGSEPFSGDIRDGYLWGRGATDMKGAVAAFCVAAARFACGQRDKRSTISMLITTDEEWAAVNGTRRVLEWLAANGRTPDAFLVGEPSSPSEFGTHIKIGRRGSLCGTLRAEGVQGHAAYPGLFVNPNRALSAALTALHAHQWDDALPGMPETRLETVALRSGDFGQTAIIPSAAEALWNIRFTPNQSVDDLVAKLRNLLVSNPDWISSPSEPAEPHPVAITANTDTVSMPYYSPQAGFASLVSSAVAAEMGRTPICDAVGGTTDGRFVQPVFSQAEIVELGLPENGGAGDALRGGMHQLDECCRVADLERLSATYFRVIQGFRA